MIPYLIIAHRTDYLLQKSVRENLHNCTVISIAHRLDTIIDCDRVIVSHPVIYLLKFIFSLQFIWIYIDTFFSIKLSKQDMVFLCQILR